MAHSNLGKAVTTKYILKGHVPIPCPDVLVWGIWFESANRQVARTTLNDDLVISTVFLGIDHSFGIGPLQLFETMVFINGLEDYMERYETWDQALEGHHRIVTDYGGHAYQMDLEKVLEGKI